MVVPTTQLPQKERLPVLHLAWECKILSEQQKSYPWPKLRRCAVCNGRRVWGHGYVGRYFDGWEERLWMKRYRCPDCAAVHTARLDSHWRGFWAPRRVILISLVRKLKKDRWLGQLSRQRQQYWWRGFRQQLLCEGTQGPSLSGLADLASRSIIVSTHSVRYRERRLARDGPYLMFASPPVPGGG